MVSSRTKRLAQMAVEDSGRMRLWLAKVLLQAAAVLRKNPLSQTLFGLLPLTLREQVRGRYYHKARALSSFSRTRAWNDASPTVSREATPRAKEGSLTGRKLHVNVVGYFNGQFGLAESARLYVSALDQIGVSAAAVNVEFNLPHEFGDEQFAANVSDQLDDGVDLICVNPDYLDDARCAIDLDERRCKLGSWFWELEQVPATWLPALQHVDGIVSASEFIRSAFSRVTDKPVHRVPLPLVLHQGSNLKRPDFGIPGGSFVFLSAFDFNSRTERKNPAGVIKAFKEAFPDRAHDVMLVVKTTNGHRHLPELQYLLELAGSDSRILFRDEVIPRRHLVALQKCCDAFVSLHRSEGFGLHLAENMALGKPVIATNWSGNTDFMTSQNSCLVDHRLVPVPENAYPFGTGQRWAEPDVASAVAHMRRLVEDREWTFALGKNAQRSVKQQLDPARIGHELLAAFKSHEPMHEALVR